MTNFLDMVSLFRGTLADGLVHNNLLPGKTENPGWPVAITCDAAQSSFGFDLTFLKYIDPYVTVKALGIISDQGIGKTFFAYKLLLTWLAESAGKRTPTISIDSLKHNNNGRPETAPIVTDILGCKVIQPQYLRMNPLSAVWDFLFHEQFRMVLTMLEVMAAARASDVKRNVLEEVLWLNFNSPRPSFANLATLLGVYKSSARTQSEERLREKAEVHAAKLQQLKDYRHWIETKKHTLSPQQYEADRLSADMDITELLAEDLFHDPLFNERQALFYEDAALELKPAVENLTKGVFGEIFTDTDDDELLQLIEQRAQSWDFKGIPEDVRSVIEVFRGAIEASALAPVDPKDPNSPPKHIERCALYIVRDEAYNAWGNPFFADAEFLRMKTLRENDITVVTLLQRLSDLRESIGSVKARNMLKEIPIWIIGRQHRADLDDIRDFLHPPEHVLRTLPTLPKAHFWVLMPGRAPRLIWVVGTDLEIESFVTNQANEALLQQYLETKDQAYYIEWLEETTPPQSEEYGNPEEVLTNA